MYLDVPWPYQLPHRPSLFVSGPLFIASRLSPTHISSFSLFSIFFNYSILFSTSPFYLVFLILNILHPTSFCTATDVPIADLFAPALTFLVAIFEKLSRYSL